MLVTAVLHVELFEGSEPLKQMVRQALLCAQVGCPGEMDLLEFARTGEEPLGECALIDKMIQWVNLLFCIWVYFLCVLFFYFFGGESNHDLGKTSPFNPPPPKKGGL